MAILGARILKIFLAPPPAFAQPELNFEKLEGVFAGLFYGLFGLVGITSLLGIVMGSYGYMMSEGDPKQLESAKKTLSWAIIGAVIGAASWFIVKIVWNSMFGLPGEPTIEIPS